MEPNFNGFWMSPEPDINMWSKQFVQALQHESNCDPHTPNVVRNLRDKEQPRRDDRYFVPGFSLSTPDGLRLDRSCPRCQVSRCKGKCKQHSG